MQKHSGFESAPEEEEEKNLNTQGYAPTKMFVRDVGTLDKAHLSGFREMASSRCRETGEVSKVVV